MKRPPRVVVFSVIAGSSLLAVIAAYYVFSMQPIPFLEGDKVVTTGDGFGFEIGMSKAQCLRVVQSRYDAEGTQLTVWNSDKRSPTEIPIVQLESYVSKLEGSDRWDIKKPARWVNDVYLTFENDRLVEIQKSRWLYERP